MSRLPQLVHLKRPNAENLETCPEKKMRVGANVAAGHNFPRKNPLRRSVSMSNISVARVSQKQKNLGCSLAKNKFSGSSTNISVRSTISSNGLRGEVRQPVGNITNKIYGNNRNVRATLPAKPAKTASSENALTKGKSKRAAWDLKGRLQDMEEERLTYLEKFEKYDMKIALFEKQRLSMVKNLEETSSLSVTKANELQTIEKVLKEEKEKWEVEKENLEKKIRGLVEALSSNNKQITELDCELKVKLEEVTSLKCVVVQLTGSQACLQAQLSSTNSLYEEEKKEKQLLDDNLKRLQDIVNMQEKSILEGETERRILNNFNIELKGNIRVFCRVRPFLAEEVTPGVNVCTVPHIEFLDEKTLAILKGCSPETSNASGIKGNNSTEFAFDKVFGPTASQDSVFVELCQLAQSAIDGFNVCIFAYGQTGSGKTYTMEGVYGDHKKEGIIPRTVQFIFTKIEELENMGWKYSLEASFVEIYNESIRDLLQENSNSHEIKYTDAKKLDTYVTNLKVVTAETKEVIMQLIETAQRHRSVAATNMNERSSRSHSVFQLKISGHNSKTLESCEGSLNLVDLAGSERLKESGSEGARLTETQNINRSLANLGNVIMAINQKQSHIPYRNSKLTHLLQNSLGGNSKTLMLVNVSPLEVCVNETLNSLRFASKVNNCHIGVASRRIKK